MADHDRAGWLCGVDRIVWRNCENVKERGNHFTDVASPQTNEPALRRRRRAAFRRFVPDILQHLPERLLKLGMAHELERF